MVRFLPAVFFYQDVVRRINILPNRASPFSNLWCYAGCLKIVDPGFVCHFLWGRNYIYVIEYGQRGHRHSTLFYMHQ